jgi:hypothetical protein
VSKVKDRYIITQSGLGECFADCPEGVPAWRGRIPVMNLRRGVSSREKDTKIAIGAMPPRGK